MRSSAPLSCLLLAGLLAHAAAQPETISLAGVIDFHCHSAPDTVGRSLNSFEVVRQARAAGMRGVVLKNHFVSTAALAQLAMAEVGGIEVYGGIVLNRSAGGLNAEAVRRMTQVEGRRGKIVWLPTYDAENQVRFSHEDRPFVAVVADGQPVAALAEVFQLCATNDLILATGHSSPAESLVLLAAARRAGVKRLLVTHVLSDSTHASIEQMKRMAALGAVMECVWLAHLGGIAGPVPTTRASKAVPVAEAARAIREVGAEHFLISSDLGQANNPVHTTGLRAFLTALRAGGLTERELALVTRENPARLLGLAP
jgi:dihydroorotase-like cyclic amidohydrolase